jgi:phosphoenolpyruvate carboxylase
MITKEPPAVMDVTAMPFGSAPGCPVRLAAMSREADRQQLPALMRRDVRLLGDLLGEIIRESGGQELLDDVERLRRAVIAARESPPPAETGQPETGQPETDGVGDRIAAMVGGWPLERAELVAKAFSIYFHLTNLAEERQRAVRELGGGRPGRESPGHRAGDQGGRHNPR